MHHRDRRLDHGSNRGQKLAVSVWSLLGRTVESHGGAPLGVLRDVLVASDGRIVCCVVGRGGVLRIGERRRAVPFEEFSNTRSARHIILDRGNAALKGAPIVAKGEAARVCELGRLQAAAIEAPKRRAAVREGLSGPSGWTAPRRKPA
jgi:hypothetical protein